MSSDRTHEARAVNSYSDFLDRLNASSENEVKHAEQKERESIDTRVTASSGAHAKNGETAMTDVL